MWTPVPFWHVGIDSYVSPSKEYTLDESLAVMKIMDSYRQQVGVIYPFETSSCSVS